MFEVGQYVVYRVSLCVVSEIKKNYYKNKDYYFLDPVNDDSLTIKVPVEKSNKVMREVITKEEIKEIIKDIPNIEVIKSELRNIENEYKKLMKSGTHRDLIKIIKTAYLRNEERLNNNKKISETDDNYFKKAEKIIYTEFSVALGLTYDETKDYIVERVLFLKEKANN